MSIYRVYSREVVAFDVWEYLEAETTEKAKELWKCGEAAIFEGHRCPAHILEVDFVSVEEITT
jgi:hypothetical protein